MCILDIRNWYRTPWDVLDQGLKGRTEESDTVNE